MYHYNPELYKIGKQKKIIETYNALVINSQVYLICPNELDKMEDFSKKLEDKKKALIDLSVLLSQHKTFFQNCEKKELEIRILIDKIEEYKRQSLLYTKSKNQGFFSYLQDVHKKRLFGLAFEIEWGITWLIFSIGITVLAILTAPPVIIPAVIGYIAAIAPFIGLAVDYFKDKTKAVENLPKVETELSACSENKNKALEELNSYDIDSPVVATI